MLGLAVAVQDLCRFWFTAASLWHACAHISVGVVLLQPGNCTATGCTACQAGTTALLVAGQGMAQDPSVCITEYCDELSDGIPLNPLLYG